MKICSVKRCNKKHESKGMCKSHAQRQRLGLPIYCECGEPIVLMRGSHLTTCLDCKEKRTCLICTKKAFQKGYCQSHYMCWYRDTLAEPTCIDCGKVIESHYRKYCDEHKLAARRLASTASQHRRRASIRVPYDRFSIYRLDGGTCYLCQSVVEFNSGHLDHILPLARGGHDADYNVAIVHSRCNQIKNATKVENLVTKFPSLKLPERFSHEHNFNVARD